MSLVPNIKYKTEYCYSWQTSTLCEKGSACFFAHGQQELRTIQQVKSFDVWLNPTLLYLSLLHIQNHQDILARNGAFEVKPNNYKTVFCKFYAEGNCRLGEHCTFAHQRRERKKKLFSQEYSQQEYIIPTWENPQVYQYYGPNFAYQYPQPYLYFQQQQEYPMQEVKVDQATSLELETAQINPNCSNNIMTELTLNHPPQTNQKIGQINTTGGERDEGNGEKK